MTGDEPTTGIKGTIVDGSRVLGSIGALSSHWRTSRAFEVVSRVGQAGRRSWLYRWLTAEPDPEVIVIDLRETWTIGPLIALLDRVGRSLVPAYPKSRVMELNTAAAARFRRRPIRLASLLVLLVGGLNLIRELLVGPASDGVLVLHGMVLIAAGIGILEERSWDELRRTRPISLLRDVLEPPEKPKDRE